MNLFFCRSELRLSQQSPSVGNPLKCELDRSKHRLAAFYPSMTALHVGQGLQGTPRNLTRNLHPLHKPQLDPKAKARLKGLPQAESQRHRREKPLSERRESQLARRRIKWRMVAHMNPIKMENAPRPRPWTTKKTSQMSPRTQILLHWQIVQFFQSQKALPLRVSTLWMQNTYNPPKPHPPLGQRFPDKPPNTVDPK